MKDIDIYDFDKTIVPFDSGSLFVGYCILHYPWCIVIAPVLLVAGLLMVCRIISFTQFKRLCFCFLPLIPKDKAVKDFWDRHIDEVYPWFKDRPRHSVVISASPDFLLEDIAKRLNFDDLICTCHNPKTGVIIGENCRDEEKVRRLYRLYDKDEINVVDVYSDSLRHDRPIFSLATGKCYHIVNGQRNEFDYNNVYHN